MATNFVHGVLFQDTPTGVVATVEATSGMNVVIGLAPVHTIEGGSANVNQPFLCNSLSDVAQFMGIQMPPNLWSSWTINEHVDYAFVENNISPVVYINVFNPAVHMTSVGASTINVVSEQISLAGNGAWSVILDSVVVKNTAGSTTYVLNTDYTLGYDVNGNCLITLLSTGSAYAASSLSIAYNEANPSAVTSTQIIGGISGSNVASGLYCIENIYPLFTEVPAIIIVPGWSQMATVAAAMLARGLSVNNCFIAESFCDVDASACTYPSQVPAWKSTNNISSPHQVLCWPLIQLAGSPSKTYHLSTALAVSCCTIDANRGGIPYASPSNQPLQMTGTVLANGNPVLISKPNADYLNQNGVVTALKWTGGWRAWGNLTAAYPADTDPHDMWIPVRRTFDWIGNTLILTCFQFVDNPGNYQLIESVTETVQLWLNALVNVGALLGARITFNPNDNPISQLINGQYVFHVYIAPPIPAQYIDFKLTFDTSYLSTLFGTNQGQTAA